MHKFFACLLGFILLAAGGYAQGALKKAAPAVAKRLGGGSSKVKTAVAKAKCNQAGKWRELTGYPFVVNPVLPPVANNHKAYKLDVDALFSPEYLSIIKHSWYFDEVKLPPTAKVSPTENYFIARNNRVNLLEKLVWHARLDYFKKHIWQIASSLDVDINYGLINYLDYIPPDVKVLYLGEAHYSSKIQEEIINVLEQVASSRPEQEIYLLTEFFPDSYALWAERRFPKWVKKTYNGPVWQRAHELNINIIGLENNQLVNSLSNKSFNKRYDARMDGTAQRNESWAYILRTLMAQKPNAFFIVYAGGAHVDASYYRNLPSLIGEEKSFIIDFDLPDLKPVVKPVFNYLRIPQSIYQDFAVNKNSKLVSFLLDEKYKKWTGFDLSVTVHIVPGEMPKGVENDK